ncbi:MAG: HDIG domain-containing protein [Desulfobacula sp.]|nr:HDIG domain-containing protein [Desulfobacula sp.]
MNIPSRDECFKLIKKMDVMDHIIDHSIMVSDVTRFLCNRLKKFTPELKIDTRLAANAALLHDITKTRSFATKEVHSETGGQLLCDMGYPEVGNIIRQHVMLDEYHIDSPVSEQEIVNYSDKRVLHDKIVSLKHRLEYINQRYGSRSEFKNRIQVMCENTSILESKLFFFLDIKPDQLLENMENQRKR